MKQFLILQSRPEDEASDEEFQAFLLRAGLSGDRVRRIRLDEGPIPTLALEDYAGVIVGGGPACISDAPDVKSPQEARVEADILSLMPAIIARDMPFMGCCYGMGILAHHLGGQVSKARYGEAVGGVDCHLTTAGAADPMLAGVPSEFRALVGHKEAVQDLPAGAVHLVGSEPCPFQMIRTGQNVYATQFHPEADGQSFATRIRIYGDRGYFPPEKGAALMEKVLAERISMPALILRNFVAKFGGKYAVE